MVGPKQLRLKELREPEPAFSIRLPQSLLTELKEAASFRGHTTNAAINIAIEMYCGLYRAGRDWEAAQKAKSDRIITEFGAELMLERARNSESTLEASESRVREPIADDASSSDNDVFEVGPDGRSRRKTPDTTSDDEEPMPED